MPSFIPVDTIERRLLLREAADFSEFGTFGVSRTLTRFFSHSDAFFRFFEELEAEHVTIDDLKGADVYAEYERHLSVLERLRERYEALLSERGLFDKAQRWREGVVNESFLRRYDGVEIFVEGYLTRTEMRLFERIADIVPLRIRYRANAFAQKMRERFAERGVQIPQAGEIVIDIAEKKVLEVSPIEPYGDIRAVSVEERSDQIAAMFSEIARYVEAGIDPERIAVVLPDESFAPRLRLYDRYRNLNFAMGIPFEERPYVRTLRVLYEAITREAPQEGHIDEAAAAPWRERTPCDADRFFALLEQTVCEEDARAKKVLDEAQNRFVAVFKKMRFMPREWLFLWLERLSSLRIDEVGGGLVTVMGVLETRAVTFDAVIVLDFNEGVVPAVTSKDRFLNSAVRRFAGLPTRSDRENLQKYYYDNLLRRAKHTTLLFARSDNRLPSKFLYELGIERIERKEAPRALLYDTVTLPKRSDAVVAFDARNVVWSASRLKTWLECPRKYYYRYVKELRSKKEDFVEGAYVHTVLQHLFDDTAVSEDDEALRSRLSSLLHDMHPLGGVRARYDAMLIARKLEGFLHTQIGHFKEGWRIEAKEKVLEAEFEGLRFTGRIDRIDENGSQTLLIDYKTGKLPGVSKHAEANEIVDLQMPIYEMLAQSDAQPLYCDVYNGGAFVEPPRMELQREALAMRIEELKTVDTLVASKCEDLKRCEYCDYRLICERGEYMNA
jgi:RecB family exonuclease